MKYCLEDKSDLSSSIIPRAIPCSALDPGSLHKHARAAEPLCRMLTSWMMAHMPMFTPWLLAVSGTSVQRNSRTNCISFVGYFFDTPQLGIFRDDDRCIKTMPYPKRKPVITKQNKTKQSYGTRLLCNRTWTARRGFIYVIRIHKIYACN